jgi:hypothetical protein
MGNNQKSNRAAGAEARAIVMGARRIDCARETARQEERRRLLDGQRTEAMRLEQWPDFRTRVHIEPELYLYHRRQRRDLEQFFLSGHSPEPAFGDASRGEEETPWVPRPPRAALALRDRRSEEYWSAGILQLSDAGFVARLQQSQLPTLDRPAGEPDLDDLLALAVVQRRIDEIKHGYDTALQRQIRTVLIPIKVGVRPKPFDARDVEDARRLRGKIQVEIGRVKRETRLAAPDTRAAAWLDLVKRLSPEWSGSRRPALRDPVGRGQTDFQASRCAADIAQEVC